MENKSKKPYPQPLQNILSDRKYELYRPFVYIWSVPNSDKSNKIYLRIVVPTLFQYDGASIPRFAWSLIGLRPVGSISAAACVHDWVYRNKGRLGDSFSILNRERDNLWRKGIKVWNRKDADDLFLRMLKEAGISATKRNLAYYGVRIFGGSSFK